ncbi:RibD family protein [Pseudohongiella sp.]|uniref:Bacterial bifunctional deaminase-reductase C-terminal domain-containing protein n=1 Tax=marine sediment metagenome TaxID=412755 RepID=A0A0F9WGH5_9ZZZZ|nr:RibD family protein [Pseudohongiella sp.]HDZ09209.1 RibD family protein [Pseudohongiella sp.]HEA63363.1 RibD family protein [Pseudohongiella sp.]
MNLNQQIEDWLLSQREQSDVGDRPFVTLSYAQSWDGSITLQSGEPLALSGDPAMQLTHHLRSLHDGILVGIGTVLSDDPRLNVRQWDGPDPQPIVLDARFRMPPAARLCHLSEKRCWVLTSADATCPEDSALEIIRLPGNEDGQVCLHEALRELKRRGINSLMVEGGANVITGFLKQKLVDAIVLTVAPRLVGGYKAVGDLAFAERSSLPHIAPLFTDTLGTDLIMWGQVQYKQTEATSEGHAR